MKSEYNRMSAKVDRLKSERPESPGKSGLELQLRELENAHYARQELQKDILRKIKDQGNRVA